MDMTIREYSRDRHITYECVRRQLKRYAEDLGDHVKKVEGVTKLDEFAQELLDRHRMPRPVIVTASNEESQQQINTINTELANIRQQLAEAQSDYIKLQSELIAEKDKALKIQDECMKVKQQCTEIQTNCHELLMQKDRELLQKDAELLKVHSQYQKSIFGLYKRVKIPAEVQDHDGKEEA